MHIKIYITLIFLALCDASVAMEDETQINQQQSDNDILEFFRTNHEIFYNKSLVLKPTPERLPDDDDNIYTIKLNEVNQFNANSQKNIEICKNKYALQFFRANKDNVTSYELSKLKIVIRVVAALVKSDKDYSLLEQFCAVIGLDKLQSTNLRTFLNLEDKEACLDFLKKAGDFNPTKDLVQIYNTLNTSHSNEYFKNLLEILTLGVKQGVNSDDVLSFFADIKNNFILFKDKFSTIETEIIKDCFGDNESLVRIYAKTESLNLLFRNIKKINSQNNSNFYSMLFKEMLPKIVSNLYKISTKRFDTKLYALSENLKTKSGLNVEFFQNLVSEIIKDRNPDGMLEGHRIDSIADIEPISPTIKSYSSTCDYNRIANDPLWINAGDTKGAALDEVEINGYKTYVGYFLAIPKNTELKGTLLRFYGGKEDKDQGERYKGNFEIFDGMLLKQGYAVAYLNLADIHENKDFQANMKQEMFNKVLDGIKVFINALKSENVHENAKPLAKLPIFAMGESFGGATVTGFMRRYPGELAGGISWNGSLSKEARKESLMEYLDPYKNVKDIADPLLLLQSWNDNRVIAAELKIFMERIKKSNSNVHQFMIGMANDSVGSNQKEVYIGHYLKPSRGDDLERIVQQVLAFFENPNNPTALDKAINERRESRINDLAPLTNKHATFDEVMKGMFKIWHTERLNQGADRKSRLTEWETYYLPKYIATTLEMANGVFKYGEQAKSEAKEKSKSWKVDYNNPHLKPLIKDKLRAEMEKVSLDEYVTEKHVDYVAKVLTNNDKSRSFSLTNNDKSKPFSLRLGFEAVAEILAKSIDKKDLNSASIMFDQLIAEHYSKNSNVWKELLSKNKEKIRPIIEVKRIEEKRKTFLMEYSALVYKYILEKDLPANIEKNDALEIYKYGERNYLYFHEEHELLKLLNFYEKLLKTITINTGKLNNKEEEYVKYSARNLFKTTIDIPENLQDKFLEFIQTEEFTTTKGRPEKMKKINNSIGEFLQKN